MPTIKDPAVTTETLEQRFRWLDSQWRQETAYQSSSTRIKSHPAFRAVVRMGEAVVPLLLRDLQTSASLWVWALLEITGENPASPEDGGNIAKMTEAWLRWGKNKGLTW